MALRTFLSYATPNAAVAQAVWERLRASQHEVFYADKTLPFGAKIPPVLAQRIKQCDVFVVLWSRAAKESDWVSQEIGIAHGSGRFIFPVVLEEGLKPPGFISDRRYLPAYRDLPQALAFLDSALRNRAQAMQQQAALRQKQEAEKALALLGLGVIVLLAIGSSK